MAMHAMPEPVIELRFSLLINRKGLNVKNLPKRLKLKPSIPNEHTPQPPKAVDRDRAERAEVGKDQRRQFRDERGSGIAALARAERLHPNDVKRQLQVFCELHTPRALTGRDRINSYGSQETIAQRLSRAVELAPVVGMPINNLREIGMALAKAVLLHLEESGCKPAYLQNMWTALNRFLQWINRGPLPRLRHILRDPARAARTYSALVPKTVEAAGLSPNDIIAKFQQVGDEEHAICTDLGHKLGLRPKELMCLKPAKQDYGNYLLVVDGTKGGRPRPVRIETAEQRQALDRAKEFAARHPNGLISSGPRNESYKARRRRFYYACERIGLTLKGLGVTFYGLRHQFANDLYERLSNVPSPVNGGPPLPRATADHVHAEIAAATGHGRRGPNIDYVGNFLQIEKACVSRLQEALHAISKVRERLVDGGFHSLCLLGDDALGRPRGNQVAMLWQGDPKASEDDELRNLICTALTASVVLIPAGLPGIDRHITFELLATPRSSKPVAT